MDVANLQIRADSSSVLGAVNDLSKLEKQSKKTSNAFDVLGRSIFTIKNLIGTVLVAGLIKAVDSFQTLETSLKNVTKSTEEYHRVSSGLFAAAQKSRQSFTGLVDAYTKLNISLPEAVANTTDLVKVTEILARGFAVSRTGAQTASAAMLQLTQGLATNFTAAGQELNSFIEGAPLLAKLVAEEFGEEGALALKRLAEEGRLTNKTFLEAVISAEAKLNEFKIPESISGSFMQLRNSFIKFIGDSDDMQTAANNIAKSITFVAENLDNLAKVAFIAMAAFGGFAASGTIIKLAQGFAVMAKEAKTLSGALALLNTAFLASPAGLTTLAFVAIPAAIAALIAYKKEIGSIAEDKGFKNHFSEASQEVKKLNDELRELIKTTHSAKIETSLESMASIISPKEMRRALGQPEVPGKKPAIPDEFFLKQTEKITEQAEKAQERFNKSFEESKSAISGTLRPLEEYSMRLKEIDALYQSEGFARAAENLGLTAIEAKTRLADQALEDYREELRSLGEEATKTQEMMMDFGSTIQNTFIDFVTGATDARSALRSLAEELQRMLLMHVTGGKDGGNIFSSLIGSLFSSSFALGTAGNPLGDAASLAGTIATGPKPPVPLMRRASGGPVAGDSPYVVGERGPELFVPKTNGSIVPNNKLGGESVVYNIDARGAEAGVEDRIKRVLMEVQKLRKDTPAIAISAVQDTNLRNPKFLRGA